MHSTRSLAVPVTAAICLMPVMQAQNPPVTDSKAASVAAGPDKVVVIPDGTAIEMRFAQPVRGKMLDPVDVGTESKPGDTVRLVSVAELRIGEMVVIAEGAMAQATIVKIKKPLTTLVATGLGLKLDWIQDVTGAHLPLRISPQGEPAPFMIQVTTPSGTVARWRVGVQDQVSFSEFETTADVIIYRTKGHGRDQPRVLCDGIGRSIGEREYIHLNLARGKHSCQIENQPPHEIAAERGAEYYFHLQHSGSGWELKRVTAGEGEDSIENADPAPKE